MARPGEAAISVITRAEVLVGATAGEEQAVLALLARYPCLPFKPRVADRAALLRRQYGWKLPDAFQAALAQGHKLRLATRNTKDFPPHDLPFVIVPYRL